MTGSTENWDDAAGSSSADPSGFLNYHADLDFVLRPENAEAEAEDARKMQKVAAIAGSAAARFASRTKSAAASSKSKQESREYNKVTVLCACEVWFDHAFRAPPRAHGTRDRTVATATAGAGAENGPPAWFVEWERLRVSSRANDRDQRRDMADAILQAVHNAQLAVAAPKARLPRRVSSTAAAKRCKIAGSAAAVPAITNANLATAQPGTQKASFKVKKTTKA